MSEQWGKSDDLLMAEYLDMVSVEEYEREITEACWRVYQANARVRFWRKAAIASYAIGVVVGAAIWGTVVAR